MQLPFRFCLSLAVAAPRLLLSTEAPLEAWLEEEGSGLLYLHTTTDVGRGYQVEWSSTLEAARWTPALARPAEGTGGRQAFYLGQQPGFDGAPPVHPARRDFTLAAYADGTSLAQWQNPDGTIVRRRVPLDFRQVPRQASAVTDTATVVTRTQVAAEAPTASVPETPDPDPDIRAALEALAEAYPLLKFSPPEAVVRGSAENGPLTGPQFWRVRRLEQDVDGDTLSDFQEWHTSQTNPLAADSDGDGASDGAEVAAGSPPLDFFDGARPGLVRLPSRWGDVPFTGPNEWLNEPLAVEVRTPAGLPLANAPITIAAGTGGLDRWDRPAALRSAHPVITARTDAAGRVALAWRSDGVANAPTLIHAWTGQGLSYQGAHLLVHTLRALPPTDPTVLTWLKSDAEVGVDAEGRVESWSDDARSVTATASGAQRPLRNLSGPLPLVEFTGSHRLDLSSALGGSSMSAFFVAQPTATRTQPPVNAADPANRTPGLTGQRYLLAGAVTPSASPWLYTAPVPRTLQTTQHFSRYTALFFTVDPVYNIRGYNCREISYSFGQLMPTLPTAQIPSVRYDITAGAIPDPGAARRERNKTYRLNPLLPNCPLKAGASLSACLSDFISRRGLPATYEWDTRDLATYTRRAGTPLVDDFRETYYETKGYSPEVPEKYELQPGSIGVVGQGIALGTNSAGYFHLAQSYAPALGTRPSPAVPPALHLTSLVIANGRPAFFTNGTAAGSSVAPAGGTAAGLRHLGSLGNATNGFVGTVGDIVLTSGALGEEARRSLEDGLADRHRLTKVDRDLDALPDWWERRCLAAGPAATPTANPDADGLTNTQERARFTLPEVADSDRDGLTDGAESAAAAITADTDGDGFLDGTDATPADPANGRSDANGDGIPDGLASLLAAPNQRDSDGDTLSDLVESLTTRTNPLAADTDGDTLPDAWEAANRLDPNDPSGDEGALGDPDSDGKTNAEERALGTNPRVAD
jgi:hypothetical protein